MVRFSFDPEKGKKSVSLMGVVNLSPDSFYAGSRCPSGDEAVRLAERHVEEGADLLDVGAESSRPGARPIPEKAELDLLLPTVSRLCKKYPVPVSVDTYKPRVAAAVLQEGASAINDITGLRNPEMGNIIARAQAGVVVMHMQGTPPTMQIRPAYHHLVEEIIAFLEKSVQTAREAGIAPDRIAVDPGFGFGKT
ncbi:MAG: dihydropteroate synthase, partial [Nitrospinaceae bacterium]|nr:dihydropteroate synthase [Nitrospinaceae bacterium]NIY13450.1 dihydropteroate synthase [Nitrospinaceae bacterium]